MFSMYSQPLFPTLLLLAFIGLLRYWRRSPKQKPILLATCLVALFLISWPPFAWLALQPFERPFPHSIKPSNAAQAIVVLPSGIYFPPVPRLPLPPLRPT